MSAEPTVLVVEDDEDDFFLTERTLRRFTRGRIVHVENGRDAIAYLMGTDRFADRAEYPFPDVVFLDLKMDPVNGHDVLAVIREKSLQPLPRIFVLTGSNEPKDRDLVKNSGVAAGYIVKPIAPAHLTNVFGG